MEPVSTLVRKQWQWIRHLILMEQGAILHTALIWVPEGKRKRG